MWRKQGQLTRTIFVGNEYGRLRVLSRGEDRRNVAWILCECVKELGGCGTIKEVRSVSLTTGVTKSCGCMRADVTRALRTKHGGTTYEYRAPEYHAFSSMKARCFSPNVSNYPSYGGRGIYVCDGWRNDFAKFLADMGPKPTPKHSIDRIDNDGSYTCGTCPHCVSRGASSNCRWATQTQQVRNRSVTPFITLNGESLPATTWAERLGINVGTVLYRHHAGYAPEAVLSVEPLPSTRFVPGHERSPRTPGSPRSKFPSPVTSDVSDDQRTE